MKIKPVLKWVGGKSAIAHLILKSFPAKFGKYYEPFLGGGAIAFSLPRYKQKYLGDINQDLIDFYKVLQYQPDELFFELTKAKKYYDDPKIDNQVFFLNVREIDRKLDWRSQYSLVERAARLIYLNRTCFNGLWRVNSKGQNNSPFGNYETLNFDFDNLKRLSFFLNHNVNLYSWGYKWTCVSAERGDLIYLDPPYDPLPGKKAVAYNSTTFDQTELKNFVDELTERGCHVVLSNAATPLILDLYRDYKIEFINARRSIAANGDRSLAKEVIITNF